MADQAPTIIIKKVRKGGHGHHGGAWKVAYADFVTAMMAFFLLLWLLSATSKETKEGIAEYFTPTIGLRDAMGIGFEGGTTNTKKGVKKEDAAPPAILPGMVMSGPTPAETKTKQNEDSPEDEAAANSAQKELRQSLEADPNFREFRDQIVFEQTPEGLKISIRDSDKQPMFEDGKAVLTKGGEKVLQAIAKVVKKMPNRISITGHTDASSTKDPNYTNWELSTDRANSARRYMLLMGLEPTRTGKVVGRADQDLLLPKEPVAVSNRRIEVVLLKNSYLKVPQSLQSAPGDLLSAPRPINEVPTPGGTSPGDPPESHGNVTARFRGGKK